MRVKLALAVEGGGAHPHPFITFTITSKVAVYAPAELADTLSLFISRKIYTLCAGSPDFLSLYMQYCTVNNYASSVCNPGVKPFDCLKLYS